MNDVIERYKRNGYDVEIIIDIDCASPRNNDGNFLFVSFPSRDAIKADEEISPDRTRICGACGGSGYANNDDAEDGSTCDACKGEGQFEIDTVAEFAQLLKDEHHANLVLPVCRDEHGPNCRYWIAEYETELHRLYGFILDTPETLNVRGFPDPITEEWLRSGMEAEIDEYSKWADGECFGFVIKDRNDTEVDSCWGHIGFDWVKQTANEEADTMPAQPELLYDVRLTKAEIDSILDRLGNQHEAHHLPVIDKLRAIDTEEDE